MPTSKRQTAAERRRLLEIVRRQSLQLSHGFFTRAMAPELFDLAIAAKHPRGRSLLFRGVRFPLKYGLHVYVCDPDTGETLVGAGGLL
jgi:hypothetical protein